MITTPYRRMQCIGHGSSMDDREGNIMANNEKMSTQPAQDNREGKRHRTYVSGHVHEQLAAAWQEVRVTQQKVPAANVTVATEWLLKAENALHGHPSEAYAAIGHITFARHWLNRAVDCAGWHKWGIAALLLELMYLVALPVILVTAMIATDMPREQIVDSTLRTVPLSVFIWGFLGGVAWCMYSGSYWTTRRLFDKHYIAWYIGHPWMSAVLGAAVSLLFYVGIVGLSDSDASGTTAFQATVSVVSFVSGFSTKYFWKVLDTGVRKLFGETGGERSVIEGTGVEAQAT